MKESRGAKRRQAGEREQERARGGGKNLTEPSGITAALLSYVLAWTFQDVKSIHNFHFPLKPVRVGTSVP